LILLLGCLLAQADEPPIDLNGADAERLESLAGIGAAKAAMIVDWRRTHGSLDNPHALTLIPHVGDATVANLPRHLRAPDPDPPLELRAHPASVDINRASIEALATLPGIDTRTAERIVQDRTTHGPYSQCEDLTRLVGIGPATVANLDERCTTGQANPRI
jgi:competence protein ComEA